MSNVSSDAVTAISRELARPGIIWASLASDEGGAVERLRRRPRLRKRAPAACTPGVLRHALWNRWKRSESTPWSVPAVDSHFGRDPKPHGRAIELEGGGGARRGAIMVQSLFTSALQYRARVQGQRDAALEPLDAGYASQRTIPRPRISCLFGRDRGTSPWAHYGRDS